MMITKVLRPDFFAQDSITVRALSSITLQQTNTIAQTVHAARPAWEVHINDDYDGYLSIFIEPSAGNHEQKSFFVSGTTKRLELAETQGDHLSPIATFNNAKTLSAELLDLISR